MKIELFSSAEDVIFLIEVGLRTRTMYLKIFLEALIDHGSMDPNELNVNRIAYTESEKEHLNL
jgi:hypothetical protein